MSAKPVDARGSLIATIFLGIGLMAAVDEIVFHQILAWHHFFDRSTPAISLLSDGLLHAAELLMLAAGFYLFVKLSRERAVSRLHAWAGLFFGAGGFQLFDGIVDHKLLRLHQVRYVDNLLPYDLAWNGFGILLLVIGVAIWRRASASRPTSRPDA
ncbi:DUF2243 domain-containing protein [Stutzerimonas stutzeri]|uniref:DUF2243 domain-containing protein n=1 Tax=Stutzerimonas stutzeri TaxID=316 RepID=UPI0015E43042|nr:DUF2243 domain-containing protein [Stutzerimonas stutzeri]